MLNIEKSLLCENNAIDTRKVISKLKANDLLYNIEPEFKYKV